MYVSLIVQPRSGSNNLTNWFRYNCKDFTALFMPSLEYRSDNDLNAYYQNGVNPKDYKYNTRNLIIKEEYWFGVDFTDLINCSDKVIFLHRENEKEHIESWEMARSTGNYTQFYKYKKVEKLNFDIKKYREEFKYKYLNNLDNFTISYEELYYGNGIERLVKYIDCEDVKNENFPFGTKYRIGHNINNII